MADGSQLRRRVRMATADEPVDNRAIANQAADELRAQIEASPIGERLERVVEEDRPLVSRVVSAETPLVEDPDTSPSAREISFHLTQPTGRGAVRSALRTPGLAADLRPRTPFGEDETGIAPEPTVTAKPERADVDILEPEQADEPDRSPAGPDRDAAAQNAATDELADLHKAQRRDRRMAIAGGVLRGVQALGAILGRVTGAPGLAGIGGMAGVASSVIPQGRAVEAFGQEHALRREQDQASARAEQTAYDRARNEAADALAERRVKAYEDATNIAAANTAVREARENRATEASVAESEAQAAQAAEDRRAAVQQLASAFQRYYGASGGQAPYEDPVSYAESIAGRASPQAIRELADQYDGYADDMARGRPRRTGGGGGGSSASIAALRQQLIAGGADEASVNAMSPRDIRALERDRQRQRLLHPERQQPTVDGRPPIDERRYSEWARRREAVFNAQRSLLSLQRAVSNANPALLRAALAGVADGNWSAEAADLRARINRQIAGYLNRISGAGVSEGEFARTMRNTGATNAIQPSVLSGFLRDEMRNAEGRRQVMATEYNGAFEEAFRERMLRQAGGAQ